MVLKLLKLEISWILQEHPFLIWLILLMQFLISAIMPTPVWSPVPWTYHSYARLLFHRDTLLTLMGLWLPVSQGGGALLPCLSLSSSGLPSSGLPWPTLSPVPRCKFLHLLEVGSSNTFRTELFRKGRQGKKMEVKGSGRRGIICF